MRWRRKDLPKELVYAGFSLGVLPAQKLAQTRRGARAALPFESCVPVAAFGDGWPQGLPVHIHGMDADPFLAGEGDIDAARALVAEARGVGDGWAVRLSRRRASLCRQFASVIRCRSCRVVDRASPQPPRRANSMKPLVEVTMDCADAPALARFWAATLGYDIVEAEPGVAYLRDPDGKRPFLCGV